MTTRRSRRSSRTSSLHHGEATPATPAVEDIVPAQHRDEATQGGILEVDEPIVDGDTLTVESEVTVGPDGDVEAFEVTAVEQGSSLAPAQDADDASDEAQGADAPAAKADGDAARLEDALVAEGITPADEDEASALSDDEWHPGWDSCDGCDDCACALAVEGPTILEPTEHVTASRIDDAGVTFIVTDHGRKLRIEGDAITLLTGDPGPALAALGVTSPQRQA
jgi:hypothetical protein